MAPPLSAAEPGDHLNVRFSVPTPPSKDKDASSSIGSCTA
jgi:hypothetical protein